jgi:hypothetical protein
MSILRLRGLCPPSLGLYLRPTPVGVLAPIEAGRRLLSSDDTSAEVASHRLLVREDLDLLPAVGAFDRLRDGLRERASSRTSRKDLYTSYSLRYDWDAELLIFTPYCLAPEPVIFNSANPINITPANLRNEDKIRDTVGHGSNSLRR